MYIQKLLQQIIRSQLVKTTCGGNALVNIFFMTKEGWQTSQTLHMRIWRKGEVIQRWIPLIMYSVSSPIFFRSFWRWFIVPVHTTRSSSTYWCSFIKCIDFWWNWFRDRDDADFLTDVDSASNERSKKRIHRIPSFTCDWFFGYRWNHARSKE